MRAWRIVDCGPQVHAEKVSEISPNLKELIWLTCRGCSQKLSRLRRQFNQIRSLRLRIIARMVLYNVQVDDTVAQTLQQHARLRGVSEEQCASEILAAYHQEYVQFPDGLLRNGRKRIIDLLSQIPCLS